MAHSSRTDPQPSSETGTVLVTGATGFIGRHLCAALRARGERVVATSRREPEDWDNEIIWRQLDVSSASQCSETIAEVRPQTVFHLASLVSGAREAEMVLPMLHANLMGTVHLLCALQQVGRGRFVQVGSQEEPRVPTTAPPSPYAAAKSSATTYCRLFAELYGVPVALARVFMVYGPGPQDERKVVPYLIRELLAERAPRLSSGVRRIDWIHVSDVALGLCRLAEALSEWFDSDETRGGAPLEVDLGSGERHSVREVAERLFAIAGGGAAPEFGAVADRPGEVEPVADVKNTERLLGWRPEISLDRGLEDTYEWFARTHAEDDPPR